MENIEKGSEGINSAEFRLDEARDRLEEQKKIESNKLESKIDKDVLNKVLKGAAGAAALGLSALMANKLGLLDIDKLDQGILNNVLLATGIFTSWLAKYIINRRNNKILNENDVDGDQANE